MKRIWALSLSHDLGVIAEICDTVAVMYAGKIVERASVEEIFNNPKHPYTKLLLKTIPRLDIKQDKLETIKGSVPSIDKIPSVGCNFYDRCPFAMDACATTNLKDISINEQHKVSCHLYDESISEKGVHYMSNEYVLEVKILNSTTQL